MTLTREQKEQRRLERNAKKRANYEVTRPMRKNMTPQELENFNQSKSRAAHKAKCIEHKNGVCSKCGLIYNGTNAPVFDFHHVDPETKDYNIGGMVNRPWPLVEEELDKCIMVCANCHRLIHWEGK